MANRRKPYEASPQTKTADLHGYLLESEPAKRAEAARGIFDQCRALIGNITDQLLRPRFRDLAEDSIQEAWSDCLTELQARRDEFLRERAERPCLRELAVSVTMRAVWRLEMRARRERQRLSSSAPGDRESAPECDAVSDLSPIDFHSVFSSAWSRLLASSSPQEREVLSDVGPLAFFADNWQALAAQPVPGLDTPRPMTGIVLERRRHARGIVESILEHELQLDAKVRQRFVRTLLP